MNRSRNALNTLIVLASLEAGTAYAAGSESAGMPQLDPTWFASQLFWLTVTFGVLYFFMAKNILPGLSNILENRHSHIQDDLDQAESLRAKAEKVHTAYEEILNEAHIQSSELFTSADEEIKENLNKALSKFSEKASKEIESTEKQINEAKATAMEDMHSIAAEVASQAAEKIVGIPADINSAKSVIQNIKNKKAA